VRLMQGQIVRQDFALNFILVVLRSLLLIFKVFTNCTLLTFDLIQWVMLTVFNYALQMRVIILLFKVGDVGTWIY